MKFQTMLNHMTPKKARRPVIKYLHTESGEVKTKAQWIKLLTAVARDLPVDSTGESFFQDRLNDGTLIQVLRQ